MKLRTFTSSRAFFLLAGIAIAGGCGGSGTDSAPTEAGPPAETVPEEPVARVEPAPEKLTPTTAPDIVERDHKTSNESEKDGYSASVVPDNMTVPEKKKRFLALVAPSVTEIHAELMSHYIEASRLLAQGKEEASLENLKLQYKATSDEELLRALKPHPQSIALAQAAMESAWGTSRFFVQANNIFGVWSFNKDEPRIAASEKRGNKTVYVKKYASLDDSIRDYYRVLARGAAFAEFRKLKMKSNDPHALVRKLDRYSERGAEYGNELSSMIRYNKFDSYDE